LDVEDIEALWKAKVDPATLSIMGDGGGMTLRERFRRTMQYQKVDRVPFFEFGYWEETLSIWHEQGLPKEIDNEWRAYEYFGIENWHTAPINVGMSHGFEGRIIEETEDRIIAVDGNKCTYETNKKGHKSIPHYIDLPGQLGRARRALQPARLSAVSADRFHDRHAQELDRLPEHRDDVLRRPRAPRGDHREALRARVRDA
jgi:hypothetical protein